VNGFLGGLVAITAPCYWVKPVWAVVIGLVAGIIVPLGIDLLEHLRIDDPIGAVPVHFLAGIWGIISIGLFAGGYTLPGSDGAVPDAATFKTAAEATAAGAVPQIKGLFEGGGGAQLLAQAIGCITCIVAVGGLALLVMKAI